MAQALQNGWWRCDCECGCNSEHAYKLQESTVLICNKCGAEKPEEDYMIAKGNRMMDRRTLGSSH